MRTLAAGCLVGLVLVVSGCGTSQDASQVAVTTIEDDWEGFYIASSNPFPTRPDLEGQDTIREIECGPKTSDGTGDGGAGTLTCTLVVGHGSTGGKQQTVHVLVRFDDQSVLRQWKFTG